MVLKEGAELVALPFNSKDPSLNAVVTVARSKTEE